MHLLHYTNYARLNVFCELAKWMSMRNAHTNLNKKRARKVEEQEQLNGIMLHSQHISENCILDDIEFTSYVEEKRVRESEWANCLGENVSRKVNVLFCSRN